MSFGIGTTLGEAVEHFIYRDLTYMFSGLLVLLILRFSTGLDVIGTIVTYLGIATMEWFKLIIVLIFSYFIGLILKEGLIFGWIDEDTECSICKCIIEHWFTTRAPNIDGYGEYGFFRVMHKIQNDYSQDILKRIARVDYFMHVSASVGIASIISLGLLVIGLFIEVFENLLHMNLSLLMGIYIKYISIIIVMAIFMVICLKENRWKYKQFKKFLIDLKDNS